MTGLQFYNEASHGVGECPACGAPIHVVGSASERLVRWCCTNCFTVGVAPYEPEGQWPAPNESHALVQ